jgi:hypothetical protein
MCGKLERYGRKRWEPLRRESLMFLYSRFLEWIYYWGSNCVRQLVRISNKTAIAYFMYYGIIY